MTSQFVRMLATLSPLVPQIMVHVLDGSLTPAKQIEFGELLVDVGHLAQAHAHERTKIATAKRRVVRTSDEPRDTLRAIASFSAIAGELARDLLVKAFTPQDAVKLGDVMVYVGREMQECGRELETET